MNTRLFFLSTFLFLAQSIWGQDSLAIRKEQKKQFRKNQHELDMNHGGIGFSFYKPGFGNLVSSDNPWIDVNMLSDIFEVKLGFGQCTVRGFSPSSVSGFSPSYLSAKEFGYHFYLGVNVPISLLAFGRQESPYNVLRGHFTIAGGFGLFNLTNTNNYTRQNTAQIWYFGINPGYRIRTPFGSVEANLNTRLGLSMGDEGDFFKGIGLYPSITFRIDALKWKYNPNLVTVQGTQTTVSNVKTTTTYNGSTYTSTQRIDRYTTTTTGDVHVNNINIGIQDIGPHIGIGPKFAFMSPKRSPYIPTSFLVGAVCEARSGFLDIGITLEGGKIGHGGKLIIKDEENHTYRKKLDRNETSGLGTLNTVNFYSQIGIDISPIFLIPFGITYDKGEATSFLSVTSGFNLGGHFSWGQQFIQASDRAVYDQLLEENNQEAKEKFIDPGKLKSGFLGGFYLSVQIGATSFKVTNYRYYGAPFASTTMYSVAYRFPLVKKR